MVAARGRGRVGSIWRCPIGLLLYAVIFWPKVDASYASNFEIYEIPPHPDFTCIQTFLMYYRLNMIISLKC